MWWTEKYLRIHMSKLEAEDHIRFQLLQPRRGTWGYSGHPNWTAEDWMKIRLCFVLIGCWIIAWMWGCTGISNKVVRTLCEFSLWENCEEERSNRFFFSFVTLQFKNFHVTWIKLLLSSFLITLVLGNPKRRSDFLFSPQHINFLSLFSKV